MALSYIVMSFTGFQWRNVVLWEDLLVPLFRKVCVREHNITETHLENSYKIIVCLLKPSLGGGDWLRGRTKGVLPHRAENRSLQLKVRCANVAQKKVTGK